MRPKILVVEDDRSVLALTMAILRRVDCDVVGVISAKEAIARLEQETYNLVVTDFCLGEETGEDVVLALRRHQPSVPVIIATGSPEKLPGWLAEPGAVARVFEKPFTSSALLATVKEVMAVNSGSAIFESQELVSPVILSAEVERMVHQVVDRESIVAITDKKGVIVYANDRFCEISGYSRSELLGQNHRLLKSGQHTPAFYKEMWAAILSGRVWRGEICNQAKDGRLYYVDTIISPLREEGLISHFIALRTDVTARKELERRLAEQNKRDEEDRHMASLGRMANGFLHDLNNVLTGVMGIATESSSMERDAMLHDAIGRMAQLTRTLREYSTGRPAVPEPFLLNPLLRCACSLVRHRKGVPKALVVDEQADSSRGIEVVGNEGQVFEVMLNLMVNALEASAEAVKPRIVLRTGMDGGNVVISVEDNGPGVPAAMVRTIFEPFVSTKGMGRGIGLSVSRSIALAHRGDLQLVRAGGDGAGACFRLVLPARTAPVRPPAETENHPAPRQKHIVLVSEDETEVRRVIARDVGRIGLSVMNAGDTADLLALAAKMKEVLAAAIIDSCEVDSEQGAVACLRRIAPQLPIILISARLTNRGKSLTPWGEVENIPKPFESEALIRALAASLDQ